MTSAAVRRRHSPAPQIAAVPGRGRRGEGGGRSRPVAKPEPAPKKPKRVVRKPPRPDDDRRNYAWRGGGTMAASSAAAIRCSGASEIGRPRGLRDFAGLAQSSCQPFTPSSSTSKISVAFGGMAPPAPRAP